MDASRWARAQALFHDALALAEAERLTFLRTQTGADEALLEEVLTLLQADQTPSALDAGLAGMAERVFDTPPAAPERIGPYRVVRRIGAGGMGEVYLGERPDLESVAAIKVLRDAWLSPARRERFAREQRTLAHLRHPSICTLYDAAVQPDGTPYLVMEYIEGVPITEHCREQNLPLHARLALLREVCAAVQHAHRHAIIHRDLKPSNILVTGAGTPKLLDFGISKQLEADAAADATRTAVRLMTPAYAAPEQVRGEPVGMHTDVYALGVILYELLTGRQPFDLHGLAPAQAERLILEQEPERPSSAARRADVFAQPVRALSRALWADLDVLCLTAMHKDPQRRYRTLEAFLRDLDHFLKGQPLEARPDTLRYRTGKYLRRKRSTVAAATLVAVVLLGLVTFYTVRLARARDAALAGMARTERVQAFMLRLFEGGDDAVGPADTLHVTTLVDRGLSEVRLLQAEPDIQATLYQTLGGIYQKLGQHARADSLLGTALELRRSHFAPDHPDVVASQVALSLLRMDQARFDDAEELARQALDAGRALSGSHPVKARALWALGRALQERGEYDEAIAVLADAVRPLGETATPERITTLLELANTQFYAGNYAASDSLNRVVLPLMKQLYGERHPRVADVLINLGAIQFQGGEYVKAEEFYRPALADLQAFFGADHPATASAMTMLGRALVAQRRLAAALELLRGALAIQERVHGPNHPSVASIINELGSAALYQDDLTAAEAYYSRNVKAYRVVYGETHYLLGIAQANLASVYMRGEQYARAEPLFREALHTYAQSLPADHLNVGITRIKLGRVLTRQRRFTEAEQELLAGQEIVARQSAPTVSWLASAREDLVIVYEALQRPEQAARWRN